MIYEAIGVDALYAAFSQFSGKVDDAAKLAINDTARRTIAEGKRVMPKMVNINAAYFNKDRFFVASYAKKGDLNAKVTGRDRPTSLLAFTPKPSGLTSGFIARRGRVNVSVKPGRQSSIDNAYILRLRSGNLGLAVRAGRAGVRKSRGARQIGRTGLWLLYGPSVNQVFGTAKSFMAPTLSNYLGDQFTRQFQRLTNG